MAQRREAHWEILVSAFVVIASLLGVTISLHIHLSSQTNANIVAIQQDMKEFRIEMKDFHTRLANQDLEFKQHMMYMHNDDKGG